METFSRVEIAVPRAKLGRRCGLCHGNLLSTYREPRFSASCRCDGILALCGRLGSEDPQCGSGDEVPLKVEGVVNRTVHAEKALADRADLNRCSLRSRRRTA
jgi:hypothetical protein